jgi:hypothetical protein
VNVSKYLAGLIAIAGIGIGVKLISLWSSSPLARESDPPPPSPLSAAEAHLEYIPMPIGAPAADFVRPWVTHVQVVDLDQDGLLDILYCEAQKNSVRWIRQAPRGTFTDSIIGEDIPGPAHVSTADLNGSGRLDVLVASMGKIMPTNDQIGAVVILENINNRDFKKHVVIDGVARVSDVRAANFREHSDQRLDLVVGQFGYNQGETRWMENEGNWKFESHIINTQSGCIHTPVADFVGDGRPHIAALISQEWEEVHLIRNLGHGEFHDSVIWGSTNEDFGSSGLAEADINKDGRPDLIYTNGDALDYSGAGSRPWHGIQWLENRGGEFLFHRVGSLAGAFSPLAVDLNGDGFVDLIAVSAFADWSKPDAISMMAWINDGHQHFTPVILAHQPNHLITVAAGDLDGNGVPVLVTGGFYAFPPWEQLSNITLWRRK